MLDLDGWYALIFASVVVLCAIVMFRDFHQPLVHSGRQLHPSILCQAMLFLVVRKMSISAELIKWRMMSFFCCFAVCSHLPKFVGRSVMCPVVLVNGDGHPMG